MYFTTNQRGGSEELSARGEGVPGVHQGLISRGERKDDVEEKFSILVFFSGDLNAIHFGHIWSAPENASFAQSASRIFFFEICSLLHLSSVYTLQFYFVYFLFQP